MGKPVSTDLTLELGTDKNNNDVMKIRNFWDGEPIKNVKALLVEFLPQASELTGSWRGVLYFENGEEYELDIIEIDDDALYFDHDDFGFN